MRDCLWLWAPFAILVVVGLIALYHNKIVDALLGPAIKLLAGG